ncbi:hypothetical protein LJC63_12505, partial [Ruminococcaceae bacterium OttesenSCG-928-L11]|nr:hypothetical protein [Ruminococcaceae bacterium OttesenSCG-928-L11]
CITPSLAGADVDAGLPLSGKANPVCLFRTRDYKSKPTNTICGIVKGIILLTGVWGNAPFQIRCFNVASAYKRKTL